MSKKGRKPRGTAPEQPPAEPQHLIKRGKLEDDAAARQKNSGHGKVTAVKWNQ